MSSRYDLDTITIKTVMGFNLKDTVTETVDENGEVKLLRGGVKSTVCEVTPEPILHKECDPKWFTTFNQALLDKIKDYHKNNM